MINKPSDAPDYFHAVTKPKFTALICIEYQKEFCCEDGALYLKEEIERTGVLKHAKILIDRARELGCMIIKVPMNYNPAFEAHAEAFGIIYAVKGAKAFAEGMPGSEWHPDFTINEDEEVCVGKFGLDSFAGTNLNEILQRNNIRTVIPNGFLTNVCVESTTRTAYEYGYKVIVPNDCCCANDQAQHEAAINFTLPYFAWVQPSSEILANLEYSMRFDDDEDEGSFIRSHIMHKKYGAIYSAQTDIFATQIADYIPFLASTMMEMSERKGDISIVLDYALLGLSAAAMLFQAFIIYIAYVRENKHYNFNSTEFIFQNPDQLKYVGITLSYFQAVLDFLCMPVIFIKLYNDTDVNHDEIIMEIAGLIACAISIVTIFSVDYDSRMN